MQRFRIISRGLAASAALALIVGCDPPKPPKPAPPTTPIAPQNAGTSAASKATNGAGPTETVQTEPAPGDPSATTLPAAGERNATMPAKTVNDPPTSAKVAAKPPLPPLPSLVPSEPADAAAMSADDAAKRGTEIFEREGDLDGSVPYFYASLKKNAKQREALLQLADVQRLRWARATEEGRKEDAKQALDEAAAMARALRGAYPDLNERERETIQQVMFIEAGALARVGDPAAALTALTAATEYGFEGFELVAIDPDFAEVRKQPDYAALAARPQAAALAEQQKAEAQHIAAFAPVKLELNWPTLAGEAANPDAWSARPALVVFFAADVRPSALQLKELAAAKTLSGVTDLALVLVADQVDPSQRGAIEKLTADLKADAVLVLDQPAIDALASASPGIVVRPTTLVLDRAGQARAKYEGWQPAIKLAGAVQAVEARSEKPAE